MIDMRPGAFPEPEPGVGQERRSAPPTQSPPTNSLSQCHTIVTMSQIRAGALGLIPAQVTTYVDIKRIRHFGVINVFRTYV